MLWRCPNRRMEEERPINQGAVRGDDVGPSFYVHTTRKLGGMRRQKYGERIEDDDTIMGEK